MLVDFKDGRMVLIQKQFAGALVVNRGWEHPVKVYYNSGNGQGRELKLNTDFWFSDSSAGEEALLEIAIGQDISMDSGVDSGLVAVTNSGGCVPEYLAITLAH
jgi:hypothetical protein